MTTKTREKGVGSKKEDNRAFERHKPGSTKPLRAADIKEHEVPRHIVKEWRKFKLPPGEPYLEEGPTENVHYEAAEKVVEGLELTAKDIEIFSILLERSKNAKDFPLKAGFFLSALINKCDDPKYVIHTRGLRKIDALCCGAGRDGGMKEIMVHGDVGDYFAAWMYDGVVTLNGKAGHHTKVSALGGTVIANDDVGDYAANNMDGGYLIAKKNVGHSAAMDLLSGTVVIIGNAGDRLGCEMGTNNPEHDEEEYRTVMAMGKVGNEVGHRMKSGVIFLWNEYLSISNEIHGGKVFHRGDLRVDR